MGMVDENCSHVDNCLQYGTYCILNKDRMDVVCCIFGQEMCQVQWVELTTV